MDNYAYIALFAFIGIAFSIFVLLLSWAIRPHRPSKVKLEPYECGEIPFGNAWRQFKVGYYIFALVFVIFDMEAIFIFPWAKELLNFKAQGLGIFAFVEMMIFIAILVVGLVYAWRKGVLKWD